MADQEKKGQEAYKVSEKMWDSLARIELMQNPFHLKFIDIFGDMVKQCYCCGVAIPFIQAGEDKSIGMRVPGLFLKRVLTDYRCIYNLLITGYTSQAGTVAASVFENAFVVKVVAGNDKLAEKIIKRKDGDIPWNVRQLVEMYANIRDEGAETTDKKDSITQSQHADALYFTYKYLCKIKHPTLKIATQDTLSTTFKDGSYGLFALPDYKEDDFSNKAWIMVMSSLRVVDAASAFMKALKSHIHKDDYELISNYLKEAEKSISDIVAQGLLEQNC